MWEGQRYTLQGQKMPQHLSRSFFLFTGKEAETQKSSDFFFSKKPLKKIHKRKTTLFNVHSQRMKHTFLLDSLPFSIPVSQMDKMKRDPARNHSCLATYWNTDKAIVEKLLPKFHVQPEMKKIRALKKDKNYIYKSGRYRACTTAKLFLCLW